MLSGIWKIPADLMRRLQLTALAKERPFPVLSRLRSLLPGA
jgi:hypothetical protein